MREVYTSFAQVDDIVNEGVLCMMKAIDKYDLEKEAKFETYLTKRIRGMIIDIARKQDWVPRSMRQMAKKIEASQRELFDEFGRIPTDQEVAKRCDLTVEKYYEFQAKSVLFSMNSLDGALEEAEEQNRTLKIISKNQLREPEECYLENEAREYLIRGIKDLREKERSVIVLYYVRELHMKILEEYEKNTC